MKRRKFISAAGSTVGALGLGVLGSGEAQALNYKAGFVSTYGHFALNNNEEISRFEWQESDPNLPWEVVPDRRYNDTGGRADNCNPNGCQAPYGEPHSTSQFSQWNDYDVEGTIPGLPYEITPEYGESLIIPVHGYQVGRDSFYSAFYPKVENGIDTHADREILTGFIWDGDLTNRHPAFVTGQELHFLVQDWIAAHAGLKLGAFIDFYARNAPDYTDIYLVGHSQGCRVILHALAQLYDWNRCDHVSQVHFLGAAVPVHAVARETPQDYTGEPDAGESEEYWLDNKGWPYSWAANYYDAINNVDGPVYNYHSEIDQVLTVGFEYSTGEGALGRYGQDPDLTNPYNLYDWNVTDIVSATSTHSSYPKPESEGGCMHLVTQNF